MILVTITHRVTFFMAGKLFWSSLTEFFIPQFTTKWRLSKRQVVSVDHPLDKSIPFDPSYVHIYLDFYPFWIRCTYFLYKEFGARAIPELHNFMHTVAELYNEAGIIYRRCQSTTNRPKYLKAPKFKLIHAVDPHLHCIPSLHILLMVYNYLAINTLIDKFSGGNGKQYAEQKEHIYNKAVAITESILFMKQHSVNCIPPSLYFMTMQYPEFTREKALSFVNDLFTGDEGVPSEKIKDFIRSQYQELLNTDIPEGSDCNDVLVDYLTTFQPASP